MSSRMQTVAAMTIMKTLLMLFNVAFWVTGVAILSCGIWMQMELYKYMELSTEFSGSAPYVFIGTGALIVLVGMLACCCTFHGQSVLLYIYAAFLMVVFVVEVSAGISAYAYRNKLKDGFAKGLNMSLMNYTTDREIAEAVDNLQSSLHCCGVYQYSDWANTPFAISSATQVPTSCCKEPKTCNTRDSNDIYNTGCFKLVTSFLDGNIGIVAGTTLGVAFLQIIGVFLSCCLAKNINKAKYEQMA